MSDIRDKYVCDQCMYGTLGWFVYKTNNNLSYLPPVQSVKVISEPHSIGNGSAESNGLFKNNIKTIFSFVRSILVNLFLSFLVLEMIYM